MEGEAFTDNADAPQQQLANEVNGDTTECGGTRWERSPLTGRLFVAARPGDRKVTSEEIYEWLRGPDHFEGRQADRGDEVDGAAAEWVGPRVVKCPISGYSVVAARPGVPKVTSEEIYEWLRNSSP